MNWGASMIVWRCISAHDIMGSLHICEGTMNGEWYTQVLEQPMLPCRRRSNIWSNVLYGVITVAHYTTWHKHSLSQNCGGYSKMVLFKNEIINIQSQINSCTRVGVRVLDSQGYLNQGCSSICSRVTRFWGSKIKHIFNKFWQSEKREDREQSKD